MTRRRIVLLAVFLLVPVTAHAGLLDIGGKERKKREAQEALLKQQAEEAKKSLQAAEQKYKELEIDRDNVLAQTKMMLADGAKMSELQEKHAALETGAKALMAQKDRLLSENQKMKKELASIVENHDRLKANFQELQIRENAEASEVGTLREALVRRVEASPQYLLAQNEVRALKQQNDTLKQTVAQLDSKLKKSLEYIRKIQDRDFKYVQQLDRLKATAETLKEQNGALIDTNRKLNETIDGAPKKAVDIAKRNEELIKETAAMHYNMGVLFTESAKFDRAVKEFERAIELDPLDEKSHFNLGYIYAEQFEKSEDAVKHFKRFLELDPDSQQAEAVKSYLVQRHVYEGKSLEKQTTNPF